MRLFIAEKPSLGRAIASAIGSAKDRSTYLELNNGNDIVTWCFGHILENFQPEDYDKKFEKWKLEDLPIIPHAWKLKRKSSASNQFKVIKDLLQKADEIVHAGDPDREGQLLVDEVLDFLGNQKPVKRILLNALDDKSVKQALQNLQDNKKFVPLRDSALGRSRADWLVGMNLSRAFSILSQRQGEKRIDVGRVMTPTMALVVRREDDIKNFSPTKYFSIQAHFQANQQNFSALWQIPENISNADGKLLDSEIAKKFLEKISASTDTPKIFSVEESQKQELQPLCYSLSSLQIDAGKKYSYSPQQVLDAVQKLYEMKFTTYPRSDCEFLPENQFENANEILAHLQNLPDKNFSTWIDNADTKIKSRVWNDKKISAHHAIIPTSTPADFKKLDDIQQKLYLLVAKKFVAQFFPPHLYLATKISISFAEEKFVADGKKISQLGWKILFQKSDENEQILPNLSEGDYLQFVNANLQEKITKPPSRFTPSALLQAMKEIHKFVRDDNLRQKLKECSGIGTEATRAYIIEKLQKVDFLKLDKKFLLPTEKARQAMKILPPEILFPDLTAVWENQLEEIAQGKSSLTSFYQSQVDGVKKIVEQTKITIQNLPPPKRISAACPKCNGILLRYHSKFSSDFYWHCQNENCGINLTDHNEKPVIQLCPVCNENFLVQHSGKNGHFWKCTSCGKTFNDQNGLPKL